eukprot:gene492-1137_t
MRFSIEDILRKDDAPRRPRHGSQGSDSDSNPSVNAYPRSSTPDYPSNEELSSSSDDCSDDVFIEAPSQRRVRTVISSHHKRKLESLFKRSQYQSRINLWNVASELGLPQHAVKVWFQNRRAKFRKQRPCSSKDSQLHKSSEQLFSPANSMHEKNTVKSNYSAIEIRREALTAYSGPFTTPLQLNRNHSSCDSHPILAEPHNQQQQQHCNCLHCIERLMLTNARKRIETTAAYMKSLKAAVAQRENARHPLASSNKSLIKDKERYMRDAIRHAKEQEIALQNKTQVEYSEVENALKDKLAAAKSEEENVEELKKEILRLEEEIAKTTNKAKDSEEFRDHTQYENDTHIKVLKKEMQDMKESYEEIAGSSFCKTVLFQLGSVDTQSFLLGSVGTQSFLLGSVGIQSFLLGSVGAQSFLLGSIGTELFLVGSSTPNRVYLTFSVFCLDFFVKNLENIKEQIKKSTKSSIEQETKIASEQALESLDNSSHLEFSDNKWLRQEVHIHKNHLANISSTVEDMEQKNVEIMSELLESQFEDVQITRQVQDFFASCDDDYPAIEKSTTALQATDPAKDDVIAVHGDVHGKEVDPSGIDWLDNYIPSFEEDPTEEFTRVAPMDLKFLCISGKRMQINSPLPKDKDGEGEGRPYRDENVEAKMEWLTKGVLRNHQTSSEI